MTMQPIEVTMDIVRPAVSVAQAIEAWAEYQAMKKALVGPEDIQKIQGSDFLKKSYWRKVERFYKLNLELIKEWHEDMPDGKRIFYATYRALHPSGAFCDGDGLDFADAIENFHNARATAHTRAKNRAISDLVGGGEVSAEEVSGTRRQGQPEPDKTQHWCEKHQANWFKRGAMRGYAHPIEDSKDWCSEPVASPTASKPLATSPSAAATPTPPRQAERAPVLHNTGELYTRCHNLYGMSPAVVNGILGVRSNNEIGNVEDAMRKVEARAAEVEKRQAQEQEAHEKAFPVVK